MKEVSAYKNINDYGVFGYTKSDETFLNSKIKANHWIFFFRLTVNKPSILHDVTKIGDRTLSCWIHPSRKFVWIGYDYNLPSTNVINLFDMNRSPTFSVE